MAGELYVITGATGNIGRVVADKLLDQKRKVRVVGRSQERLKRFVDRGAEAFVGTLEDAAAVTSAFEGATAAFTMIPPNTVAPGFRAFQNKVGEAIAAGLSRNRVRQVVNLSSVGAHLSERTGPILGLRDQEKRLDGLPGVS